MMQSETHLEKQLVIHIPDRSRAALPGVDPRLLEEGRTEAAHLVEACAPRLLKLLRTASKVAWVASRVDAAIIDARTLAMVLNNTHTRFAQGQSRDRLVMSLSRDFDEILAPGTARPLGSALADLTLSSLTLVWRQRLGRVLSPVANEDQVGEISSALLGVDVVVCGWIDFTAPCVGRLIVAGRAESFIA